MIGFLRRFLNYVRKRARQKVFQKHKRAIYLFSGVFHVSSAKLKTMMRLMRCQTYKLEGGSLHHLNNNNSSSGVDTVRTNNITMMGFDSPCPHPLSILSRSSYLITSSFSNLI